MAGDWIKVEKATARKPEVLRLADLLSVHPDQAFGLCVRFWFWCDDNMTDGNAPGVTHVTLDAAFGHTGFVEALLQVGWLRVSKGCLEVPNFHRHLSDSAKNRALSSERQRAHRSRSGRDKSVTRREEEREENQSLNSEWKANGSASQAPQPSHSRGKFLREGKEADLTDVDWGQVSAMAEAVGRKVPVLTTKDRRAWMRFAVLASTAFSEAWLMDSADAVVSAKETRRTRQAHLVGVLRSKAAECGIDKATFVAMLRSIEIPTDVWKSGVLEIRK